MGCKVVRTRWALRYRRVGRKDPGLGEEWPHDVSLGPTNPPGPCRGGSLARHSWNGIKGMACAASKGDLRGGNRESEVWFLTTVVSIPSREARCPSTPAREAQAIATCILWLSTLGLEDLGENAPKGGLNHITIFLLMGAEINTVYE